jgi:outer membrane protein assembly factor BamD
MNTRVAQAAVVATLAVALFATGCAKRGRGGLPPGTLQPDRFLFERGNEELARKRWLTAREFYKQVTETYTQSPIRPDAKLGIGDTYLGEGSSDALVLAIAEFQEFLSFYPTHPRADYAQYKLGMAHHKQMRSPQRDQTETRDAIREFQAFITRYPNSALMPEVRARLRESRDRLSTSEFEVGLFYYKIRWYAGAIDRLGTLVRDDPEFTHRDDVYFYLAEAFLKVEPQGAQALPWFERLVKEFERSEHLEEAQRRIEALKNQPPPAAAASAQSAAR